MQRAPAELVACVGLTLYLLDVQPKPSPHYPDGNDGDSESETAIVTFHHGILPSLQLLGGDFQASLNILIYQVVRKLWMVMQKKGTAHYREKSHFRWSIFREGQVNGTPLAV